MKTDFDFIRDKFENSGVNAPEDLDKAFALEKIADITPEKPKRRTTVKGLSLAAAVALVTVTAFGVTSLFSKAPADNNSPIISGKASLSRCNSKSEIKTALKKIFKETEKRNSYNDIGVLESAETDMNYAGDSAAGGNPFSSYAAPNSVKTSSALHNTTYVQETGVDEADTVKTDGTYIYYLADNKINVFTTEGKDSKQISSISLDSKRKNSGKYCSDFYLYENKLVAVENVWNYSSQSQSKTMIDVYDISDVKNARHTDSFTQSGYCCSTRMIDDKVYVVSTFGATKDYEFPVCGNTYKTATPDEIPANDIYCVENPSSSNFLVVSEIDTSKSEKNTKTKAILGSADEIYCNTEHLFVTAQQYTYPEKTATEDQVIRNFFYMPTVTSTQIVKVDLLNDLDFTASAKVPGHIDNQYALDEKDGNLRVATTTNRDNDGNYIQSNSLYILDSELNQLGKVTGFAENESIKAVRYIGDTAYVITYEETDPLFVIDTKDVKNPKILGEVKISGFSTMLVPVDENTLLGIGYHTEDEDYTDLEVQEGIKLALFDVSDKSNPKVLDEIVFKGCDSPVQYNPKALVVNYERNDYAIPYTYYDYDEKTDEDKSEAGSINFKVENGKLKLVDKYVSDRFADDGDTYSDLERCVYVGDYIYMLGSGYSYSDDAEDGPSAMIDAVKYK